MNTIDSKNICGVNPKLGEHGIRELLIAQAHKQHDEFKSGMQPKLQIGRLPENPGRKDLQKFCKIRLRKKRAKRKFEKYWYRYVPESIYAEYMAKVFVKPLLNPINYSDIGRKLFMVEELPQGAYARYQKDVTK